MPMTLPPLAVPSMFFLAYGLWDIVGLARQAWPGFPRRVVLAVVAALGGEV